MSAELDSLLDYLERGYVLVSNLGVNGPLADKVSKEFNAILINPGVIRQAAEESAEGYHPNACHLKD